MEQDWTEAKTPQHPSIRWTEAAEVGKEETTVYLGTTIEGLYLEKKEGVGGNDSTVYTLQLANGTKVQLWGTTVIDDRMKVVPLGYQIRVVLNGFKKAKIAGRKPWGDFTVMYAKPAMVTAPSGNAAQATAPAAPAADPLKDF